MRFREVHRTLCSGDRQAYLAVLAIPAEACGQSAQTAVIPCEHDDAYVHKTPAWDALSDGG